MIRPLRRTHYWIWLFLPALLFLLFIGGLATRQPTTLTNPSVYWREFK